VAVVVVNLLPVRIDVSCVALLWCNYFIDKVIGSGVSASLVVVFSGRSLYERGLWLVQQLRNTRWV
jgi:hypothetical protein